MAKGKTPIGGVPITDAAVSDEHDAVTSSSPVEYSERERIAILEQSQADTRRRLREGATTFEKHRLAIEGITADWASKLDKLEADVKAELQNLGKELRPQPVSKLQLFGALFGAVVFAGTLVWWASRYPERGEFDTLRSSVNENRSELRLMRLEMNNAVERIRRVEEKKP